jgi:5-methyltetrahydrofolate--homocysteine methyltransferase
MSMTLAQETDVQGLLEDLLARRILLLDGAMGTMIQALRLTEAAKRGERFAHHPADLSNFSDLLCLTQPEAITEIHRKYLAAGADIVETNTFGASVVGVAEFNFAPEFVRELNVAAVHCARRAVDEFNDQTPDKPRFVAGSIGPTTKQMAISTSTESAAHRGVTYEEMVDS